MKVMVPAARVYGIVLAIALLWIFFQKRLSWSLFVGLSPADLPRVMLLTLGAAGFLIGISIFCSRNFHWAQELEAELSKILVPLPLWQIAALGMLSGFAEETFFRGALQASIGIIPASLAFGLAHFIPRHPYWHWSLHAAFAGFLLGCLFELTGCLLPVVFAHSLTNFILIVVLNRRNTMEPAQ